MGVAVWLCLCVHVSVCACVCVFEIGFCYGIKIGLTLGIVCPSLSSVITSVYHTQVCAMMPEL